MKNAAIPVLTGTDSVNGESLKARPILFSGPMVRAILEGRKTQTRRVMKKQPLVRGNSCHLLTSIDRDGIENWIEWPVDHKPNLSSICPYGKPGDRLWVRETFAVQTMSFPWGDCGWAGCYDGKLKDLPEKSEAFYRADNYIDEKTMLNGGNWRPSIFMPRWASRITLEIESVHVERAQEISEEDAKAEGVEWGPLADRSNVARQNYRWLWDAINSNRGYGWEVNPWVWIVTFRRVEQEAAK